MIECAIFDCDGTLVDSEPLSNKALELTLSDYGIHESATSLLAEFRGWKFANVCQTLEARHSIPLDTSFAVDYRRLMQRLFTESLLPIPGVIQALAQIDLPMCVASSGPADKIEQSLTLTGLKRFFGDNIFSSYVVKSWKPDPGLFLHAAQEMGFAAGQCAVVEDSDLGIQAALNARIPAFWFTDKVLPSQWKDSEVICFHDMQILPRLLAKHR